MKITDLPLLDGPGGEEGEVRHHGVGPDGHHSQVGVTRVIQVAANVANNCNQITLIIPSVICII